MSSNITVSGLTLSSGVGHNLANWSVTDPNADGLPYRKLANVELWACEVNDRDSTDLFQVAEGKDSAPHMGLSEGQTYYYWIRARDNEGSYGDWHPSGTTSGVEATSLIAPGTVASGGVANAQLVASDNTDGDLIIELKTLAGTDPSPSDPIFISFLSLGVVDVAKIDSALSLTIPAGATLGVTADTPFRLWVYALQGLDGFGDPAYVAIGVVNYGYNTTSTVLEVSGSASRNAISSGSSSTGRLYSDAANTTNRYRLLGNITFDSSDALSTPGTWVAPSSSAESVYVPGNYLHGQTVKSIETKLTAVSTHTDLIPNDDTTPLEGEGEDIVTISHNAEDPIGYLTIEGLVNCSHSVDATVYVIAKPSFDTTGSAIAAGWAYCRAGEPCQITVNAWFSVAELDAAGGARDIVFAVGADTAGTLTVNGIGGSRKLGGALTSWFRVTERRG